MIENETNKDCNIAIIAGRMSGVYELYHTTLNEKFMKTDIYVNRNSEVIDIIPIVISEKLLNKEVKNSEFLKLSGQIRSFNKEDRSVETYLFVKDVEIVEPETYINTVELKGILCKKGQFKTTNSGRKVSNFILVIKRGFNKYDYLPIIAWGKNSKYVLNQDISSNLHVIGRYQSRQYIKRDTDNNCTTKLTYEISSSQIIVLNQEE